MCWDDLARHSQSLPSSWPKPPADMRALKADGPRECACCPGTTDIREVPVSAVIQCLPEPEVVLRPAKTVLWPDEVVLWPVVPGPWPEAGAVPLLLMLPLPVPVPLLLMLVVEDAPSTE